MRRGRLVRRAGEGSDLPGRVAHPTTTPVASQRGRLGRAGRRESQDERVVEDRVRDPVDVDALDSELAQAAQEPRRRTSPRSRRRHCSPPAHAPTPRPRAGRAVRRNGSRRAGRRTRPRREECRGPPRADGRRRARARACRPRGRGRQPGGCLPARGTGSSPGASSRPVRPSRSRTIAERLASPTSRDVRGERNVSTAWSSARTPVIAHVAAGVRVASAGSSSTPAQARAGAANSSFRPVHGQVAAPPSLNSAADSVVGIATCGSAPAPWAGKLGPSGPTTTRSWWSSAGSPTSSPRQSAAILAVSIALPPPRLTTASTSSREPAARPRAQCRTACAGGRRRRRRQAGRPRPRPAAPRAPRRVPPRA